MAKFFGAVGFAQQVQTAPGVYQEKITEIFYSGEDVKVIARWQDGENLNPNLNIDNHLSIISDPFAEQNFHSIRYICRYGAKWQVKSVEVKRPRLILTIGGVYNDQQTGTTSENSGGDSGQ